MQDFNEKKKIRMILYSKTSLFLLLIPLFIVVKAVWGAYTDKELTKENTELALEKKTELEEREAAILEEIGLLATPNGIENEIRNKYQVAREGEKMVMIVNKKTDNLNTDGGNSFINKIKGFFGF